MNPLWLWCTMVNTITVPWYYHSTQPSLWIKTVCSHCKTYNVTQSVSKPQSSPKQAQTPQLTSRSWSDQTMNDLNDEQTLQRNNQEPRKDRQHCWMHVRKHKAIKYHVHPREILTAASANERLWMNGGALLSLSEKYNLSAPVSGQNRWYQRRQTESNPIRGKFTSMHASNPQSSFKDAWIFPTLLMEAPAGVCSFPSPPSSSSAVRASERGLRYMTRREIFSNCDANGQNAFGKRPGSKRHFCSCLFCHPGARSLSGCRCHGRRRGP